MSKDEMTREITTRTIEVKAFLGNGKPTCAIDFRDPANGVCQFLGLSRFGTREECAAMVEPRTIHREFGDSGFLRPVEGCPVWNMPE